jgi:hypothetical protein
MCSTSLTAGKVVKRGDIWEGPWPLATCPSLIHDYPMWTRWVDWQDRGPPRWVDRRVVILWHSDDWRDAAAVSGELT